MQFFATTIMTSLLALSTSALPVLEGTSIEQRATNTSSTSIDPALVPVFSIKTGSLKGANGVAIPADCPPARDAFISKLSTNVAAGNVLGTKITFNNDPTVIDANTNKTRATAMLITLQNFTGKKGVGCPAASTPELLTEQKTGAFS